MKRNVLSIIICILFIIHASCTNAVPQGLLIFLDDSEKEEIGAPSEHLLTALSQKAGPLLASASLLTNIFSEYEETKIQKDIEKLSNKLRLARLKQQFTGVTGSDLQAAKKEEKFILLKAIDFDPNQWIIKKINDSLYLYIPKDYLEERNIDVNQVKAFSSSSKVSEIELKLGLKVNHMKSVTFEESIQPVAADYRYATYFTNSFYNTSTKSSDIFCINADYKNMAIEIPLWVIYMSGHGKINEEIVGMKLLDFQEWLDFLEKKVRCIALIYTSCYAAGLNNEIIYNDVKAGIQKTYSFAIITQAITETPVQGYKPDVENYYDQLKLKSVVHFDLFLKDVARFESTNYEQLTKYLFPLTPLEELKESETQVWGNVPQIKLPGIEWFSVMASRNDVVAIGSILAKTRKPDWPLDIVQYFKTDPKALLLYAYDIPFELIINSKRMEAIISMIPGDAFHKLKKISSSETVNTILEWFMKIIKLDARKTFFIESINNINNVIIYYHKILGNKWKQEEDKYETYAFFSDKKGTIFKKIINEQAQEAEETEKKLYQRLVSKAQGNIAEIKKTFTFQSAKQIAFPRMNEPMIINKIESVDPDASLSAIITELKIAASYAGIIWIKELQAPYDKSYIEIENVNKGDTITLKDIIIDKERNIFFTYNNKFYKNKSKITDDYKNELKKQMAATNIPKPSEITAENIQKIEEALKKRGKKPTSQPSESQKNISQALKGLTQSLEDLKNKIKGKTQETEKIKQQQAKPSSIPLAKFTPQEIAEKKKIRGTKTSLSATDLKEAVNYIKNKVIAGNQNIFLLLDDVKTELMDKGYDAASASSVTENNDIEKLLSARYGPSWTGQRLVLDYVLKFNNDKIVDVGWKIINVFSEETKKSVIDRSNQDQTRSQNYKRDFAEIIEKYSAKNYENAGYKIEDKKTS